MADWKRFVDPEASTHLQTRLSDARVFIAVDTSASTEWDLGGCMNAFESERQFANAVDETLFSSDNTSRSERRSSLHISKWGSACKAPVARAQQLYWDKDLGGTEPSQIFAERKSLQCLRDSDFWCLFTDGEVDENEVVKLHQTAKHYGALTIPVIILITGCKPLSEANLSVGMALYANVPDAMFLYKQIGTQYQPTRIYVHFAKGRFAPLRPTNPGGGDNDYPSFSNEKAFWDECAVKRIKVPRAEERSRETPGVQIGTAINIAGRTVDISVDIGKLVLTQSITPSDLESILAPQVFNDVALATRTQGQTDQMRSFLETQRPHSVVASLQDKNGAGDLVSQAISSRNDLYKGGDDRARIREAHAYNRAAYQTQADDALREANSRNQAINTAMDHLSRVESSPYDANLLTSQPTPAQQVSYRSLPQVHISRLDFNAVSCFSRCELCYEDKAMMSLAIKRLDSETIRSNKSQGAAACPILYGKRTADRSPFSKQIICYECANALMPRSIDGDDLSAIVPVTQYQGDNKDIINKSFYDALTGGADVGEVQIGQMAIALLDRSMEVSWIRSDHKRRAIFNWLLFVLLDNAVVPEKFSLGSPSVVFREALQWILQDCDSTGAKSYAAQLPADALVVIASLGKRKGIYTGYSSARLADARVLHLMIDTYLQTEQGWRSSSRSWQNPWHKMAFQTSASNFWKDLRNTVNINALHGLYSTSTDSFLRSRTIIYLLLYFQNGKSTVAEFVDHLQNIGMVLANSKFLMRGSWTDLDSNSPPSSTPAETLHGSSLSNPSYSASTQVTYTHPSTSTPQSSYRALESAVENQDLYEYPTTVDPGPNSSSYRTLESAVENQNLYEYPTAVDPGPNSSSRLLGATSSAGVASRPSATASETVANRKSEWTWYSQYNRHGRWLPSGEFEWDKPVAQG